MAEAHFCASCGAPIPAGAQFCPTCGAEVEAVPDAAPSEGGAAPTALDGRIRDLLREGRKIEAIKEARAAGYLGLAEAKDYVEALEAGIRPPSSPAGPFGPTVREEEPRRRRSGGCGCGGCLVLLFLLAAAAVWGSSWAVKSSGAYTQIFVNVWSNPGVEEALGKPGPASEWALLEWLKYDHGFWTLKGSFPLKGSKRTGRIHFQGVTRGGFTEQGWDVRADLTWDENGQHHRLPISAPPPKN
jgi:hypothetical protein